MDVTRGFVIVSLGDREAYVQSLVANILLYSSLPIQIYATHELGVEGAEVKVLPPRELQWLGHPRWGVRNCNVWSARASLEAFESCCVLNDDMKIVHDGFLDGFILAERFGVCVPLNPRIYLKYNARGTDAGPADYLPERDGPPHAPACNVSPMFVCRLHVGGHTLIRTYLEELQVCMRGTLAFSRASWRCGVAPIYLPEHWCVCGSSARPIRDTVKTIADQTHPIEPMMLHWGQAEVREVFQGRI